MEVIPYKPEHLGELLNFLREQYRESPQKGNPAFFEWRFAQNPLGSSLDSYYLAIENNRIVGQLATIRDRIWANGKWWDCCWQCDLIMAPEHRGPHSMAVLHLFEAVRKHYPLLLATGVGPRLAQLHKTLRFGYREIYGTYYAVRRPGPLLAIAGEARASQSLLTPAGWAMTALQTVHGALRRPSGIEFEFALLDRFGEETDDLIERALGSLSVTSYRSSKYLNWKFNQRPEGTHFVVTARRRGRAQLSGYMAVKIMERRPQARWAEIVDFLIEPRDGSVLDSLLDQATEQALKADVDFLRLRCSLPEHRNLVSAPFWILNNRPVVDGVFYWTRDAELRKHLSEESWHLTSLVSDRTDHGADEWQGDEG